jgi:hypothetical protein
LSLFHDSQPNYQKGNFRCAKCGRVSLKALTGKCTNEPIRTARIDTTKLVRF